VKKAYQAAWLVKAVQCMDLTTLSGDDTPGRVRRLCAKARQPLSADLLSALGLPSLKVGAVCVYHEMVAEAVHALQGSGIPVAVVSTGFPAGLTPMETKLREIELSVAAGAKEVDIELSDGSKQKVVLKDGKAPETVKLDKPAKVTWVKVIVRSGFEEMKASPWEKEDAIHEGIPIINFHVPKAFLHDAAGKLTGMSFEVVKAVYDDKGRRSLVPTGEPDAVFDCDEVLIAVGQENAFPWIERDAGIDFDQWGLPVLGDQTFQSSSAPKVFFGGDAAYGPKNIITAVAHGHDAAVSIDRFLHGEDVSKRPGPQVNLVSQKMGIHEWSYDNAVSNDLRHKVPWEKAEKALASIKVEVELGFDLKTAYQEAERCLNCDVQTVFNDKLCIECDACVDICPMDSITFTENGDEAELRTRLKAPATNTEQDLYVSQLLKTNRVMVKDEDVCLHCGLCAERCPTGAWDMQKFLFNTTKAGSACRDGAATARTEATA
jgi:deoxyribose-phosphate aldolase